MKNEYVSLIVPCYNVAGTLQGFIDSVLQQTYPYIQIIAVDDGSSDGTAEIWKFNVATLRERGIFFTYVYQQNAGLGAAINTGLKYIDGEFLCWADPDDFFMPDSFQKRVHALREHPDCGVVTSDAYYYNAKNLDKPISRVSEGMRYTSEPMQFEYLLEEQSIFCAGCHMVRMSAFNDVNPAHEIYPARHGQNWQMLLPLYYKYPRFFLPEPLYGYVIYPQSMSRGDKTEKQVVQRWNEHEAILMETLQRMQMDRDEREKYIRIVRIRYARKRFYTAIDFRNKKEMVSQYRAICKLHGDTEEIHRLFLRNRNIVTKALGKALDLIEK